MKAFKLFSLFVAGALSVATVKAQTADEIVNKHIDAVGGADNWKKITSMVLTGSVSFNGAEVSITVTVDHNKGMRRDIVLMGMNGYSIVTPTAGWNYMPFGGGQATAEPMTADDLKEAQNSLDVQGSLLDYKVKEHSIELLGKEDVDGTECFKIKVTQKSGKTETYFFDTKTYYIVKSSSVLKANGQEAEVTTGYSNYQKLPEGIIIPMTLNVPLGGPGGNADFIVSKVEINKKIDDSIFKPAN